MALFSSFHLQEEGLDIESSETSSDKAKAKSKMLTKIELNRPDCKAEVLGTAPVKRRMFFLMVHGVMPEEPSTILKITQESTVSDVIAQALTKANKAAENVYTAIRRDGTQKNVIDTMQTRMELYDRIDYHSFEQKLDALFAQKKNA